MNMPVDTLADPIAAHAKEMLAHLGEEVPSMIKER